MGKQSLRTNCYKSGFRGIIIKFLSLFLFLTLRQSFIVLSAPCFYSLIQPSLC